MITHLTSKLLHLQKKKNIILIFMIIEHMIYSIYFCCIQDNISDIFKSNVYIYKFIFSKQK